MTQYALPGGSQLPIDVILTSNYSDQDGNMGAPDTMAGVLLVRGMNKHSNGVPSGTDNPAVINDNVHIKSPPTTGDHIIVCRLDSNSSDLRPLGAPPAGVTTGFILRTRLRKDLASGGVVNALIELRQNYISEGSLGVLICQITQSDVTPVFTTFTHTLTADEVNTITNYSQLYLRVVGSSV